ncbi:hypothetical protein JHK87_052183 [Glycine soja]|nr:hypothetical protein JHK87_052183 [Glycine soja]
MFGKWELELHLMIIRLCDEKLLKHCIREIMESEKGVHLLEFKASLDTYGKLCIVTGRSVSFLLGNAINWRELPLAKVSHKKEFQLALSRLQGKDVDISDEAAKILELSKLS